MPKPDFVEELLIQCLDRDSRDWDEAIRSACDQYPDAAEELMRRYRAIPGFSVEAVVEPPVPQRLGEFRIESRLGSGGMGVVYRAVQESLGRVVAVKLVRPEFQFFDHAKLRFQREVSAVASLQHPSVVSIYSVGESDGMPFYAMELLSGRSLAEVIHGLAGRAPESLTGRDLLAQLAEHPVADGTAGPSGPMPVVFAGSWVEAAIEIARQLGDALAHAHHRGILHRDIKPSNIMLTPAGRVVLLDFGLTSLLEDDGAQRLTRSGTPVGTMAYMAPEQIQGLRDVGPPADIYSLGVTLYELLTLRVPFEGDRLATTQRSILEADLHPVRARNRAVSEEVQTVCQVAMARHVGDRYATARRLVDDLDCLQQRRPIHARPPDLLRRTRRWIQRRPAQAMVLALTTILAVGVPTGLWRLSSDHAAVLQTLIDSERQAKELAQRSRARLAEALQQERDAKTMATAAEATAIISRDAEEQKAGELSDVVDYLVSIFREAVPGVSGASPSLSAKDLIARSIEHLDASLGQRPASLARVKLILGTIHGGFGQYQAAIDQVRVAVAYYQSHETSANAGLLAESCRILSASLATQPGKLAPALQVARQALAAARRAFPANSQGLVRYLTNLALLLALNGETAAVEKLAQRLEAGARPDDPRTYIAAGIVHGHLANALLQRRQFDQAEPHLRRSVELLADGDELRHEVAAKSLQDLALVLRQRRDYGAAIAVLERGIRGTEQFPALGKHHFRTLVLRADLLKARLLGGLAGDNIVAEVTEIAERLERGLQPMHGTVISARITQMRALGMTGRFAEALQLFTEQRLLEKAEKVLAVVDRLVLASLWTNRATCHTGLKQHGAARDALAEALKVRRKCVSNPRDPALIRELIASTFAARRCGDTASEVGGLRELIERTRQGLAWYQARRGPAEAGMFALRRLATLYRDQPEALAVVQRQLARREPAVDKAMRARRVGAGAAGK